jgi:exodeoxyribonuclease VII large subunit
LTVLRRRFPALSVLIYPAQVQGAGAVESIQTALALANTRGDCEVLILARGGGSLEDLAAFNDETLARAIRASWIPVVTGIGHEVDISIADLVADRRAATPSAAAELVAPSAEHVRHRFAALAARLAYLEGRLIAGAHQRLDGVTRHLRLLHPVARLLQQAQRVDQMERHLTEAMQRRLRGARDRLTPQQGRLLARSPKERLAHARADLEGMTRRLQWARNKAEAVRGERLARAAAGLQALSPLATLARGYSIVSRIDNGIIVRCAADAPPGTAIEARLQHGSLHARVEPPPPSKPQVDVGP